MTLSSAAAVTDRLQRIPKAVLFGAAALIQLGLLAVMVIDRAEILRDGKEVTLRTQPVDPRDLLRGDYVVLGYDISQLPAGALKDQPAHGHAPVLFVKLAPDRDGVYHAVSVHTEPVPVQGAEVLIRGRAISGANCGPKSDSFCDRLGIRYDIENYFVPQGEGQRLEQLRNERKLMVVAAVLPSGRAAIKRLLVDGKPAYEEPWY